MGNDIFSYKKSIITFLEKGNSFLRFDSIFDRQKRQPLDRNRKVAFFYTIFAHGSAVDENQRPVLTSKLSLVSQSVHIDSSPSRQ